MSDTPYDAKLRPFDPSSPPSSIPSRTADVSPTAQLAGVLGMVSVLVGVFVRFVNAMTTPPFFGKTATFLGYPVAKLVPYGLIGLGVACLLLHELLVRDAFTRRSYGLVGYLFFCFGVVMTAVAVATGLGASLPLAYGIAGVLGLLIAAATAAPVVRDLPGRGDHPSDAANAPPAPLTLGSFLPRWLGGLSSNHFVLQATLVPVAATALFLAGAYVLQRVLVKEDVPAPSLLPYGLLGLILGVPFLFIYTRREAEGVWKDAAVGAVGIVSIVAAVLGVATVMLDLFKLPDYAMPYGLGVAVIGLLGTWAYVIMQGADTDMGHRAAWAMIALGCFAIVVAITRSIVQDYVVPNGCLFVMLGALYAGVGAAFALDNPLVVLTRRELTVIFYSPIGYFVLGSITLVAWTSFYVFADQLGPYGTSPAPKVPEPITRYYLFDIFPVIFLLINVPALTMRLVSEEKASGTIEVLLTAPVTEFQVVLSKFFGAWIFFMLSWGIWTFFPMTLRIFANETFDYRPLLSFYVGMAFMGAAFVSMGLFFSTITRDQIVALLVTFTAMIFLTVPYFILFGMEQRRSPSELWVKLLEYTSYLYQMREMVNGKLHLIYLVLHSAFTVVWLTLSVMVLAARRWK